MAGGKALVSASGTVLYPHSGNSGDSHVLFGICPRRLSNLCSQNRCRTQKTTRNPAGKDAPSNGTARRSLRTFFCQKTPRSRTAYGEKRKTFWTKGFSGKTQMALILSPGQSFSLLSMETGLKLFHTGRFFPKWIPASSGASRPFCRFLRLQPAPRLTGLRASGRAQSCTLSPAMIPPLLHMLILYSTCPVCNDLSTPVEAQHVPALCSL